MALVLLCLFLLVWPVCGAAGQRLAKARGRDPEFWLFACALGGPLVYGILRALPPLEERGRVRARAIDRYVGCASLLFVVGLLASTLVRACLGAR